MLRYLVGVALVTRSVLAFDVMLDIGHTPTKYGALSANCEKEYNYNVALGRYLLKHLANHATIKATITPQREICFKERYRSSIQKDLFLSLHHDSVQERFIKRDKFGCPSSNHASGFSIFISRKNPYFKESWKYAKKLGEALVEQGLTPSLHHAEKIQGENRELLDRRLGIYVFDDLKVLKNAKAPAILFEAGVIVNPIDEEAVQSDGYKNKIGTAISHTLE